MKKLSIMFVLLAAACGSSSHKKTTENNTTTVAASAAVQLELGEMKLVDVSKNQALTIQADGTIIIPDQPDGDRGGTIKVTTDGKILAGDKVGFQLMADGTIVGLDGKPIDVTLSADAVITSGDKKISLDAGGALIGANPEAPQMRVEGATTVGLKRTALFVLIALTSGEPREAPPATSVTPAG
ncbi:MAG: hypothetical protein H0T89_29630 [Deltaproteobacteria bacterium]|nr:hypothetical protein [Deltaproteobacteria bacterium]MDQ3296272.1 hypothetical protein [Myxococcota bacterium]